MGCVCMKEGYTHLSCKELQKKQIQVYNKQLSQYEQDFRQWGQQLCRSVGGKAVFQGSGSDTICTCQTKNAYNGENCRDLYNSLSQQPVGGSTTNVARSGQSNNGFTVSPIKEAGYWPPYTTVGTAACDSLSPSERKVNGQWCYKKCAPGFSQRHTGWCYKQ